MGLSLDGYAARPDDGLDFLPAVPEEGSDGFSSFLATVDVLVMGRRTFEVVRALGPEAWMYGETPVIVLSRTADPARLLEGAPPTVSVRAGEPEAILDALAAEGADHVYVDGAATARSFLAAGKIDDIVITFVPVLIGTGISPWGPLPKDVALTLVASAEVGGGMVQLRYAVRR
jgi:dihydrofolate reductase